MILQCGSGPQHLHPANTPPEFLAHRQTIREDLSAFIDVIEQSLVGLMGLGEVLDEAVSLHRQLRGRQLESLEGSRHLPHGYVGNASAVARAEFVVPALDSILGIMSIYGNN
jgi:hypothetical protein